MGPMQGPVGPMMVPQQCGQGPMGPLPCGAAPMPPQQGSIGPMGPQESCWQAALPAFPTAVGGNEGNAMPAPMTGSAVPSAPMGQDLGGGGTTWQTIAVPVGMAPPEGAIPVPMPPTNPVAAEVAQADMGGSSWLPASSDGVWPQQAETPDKAEAPQKQRSRRFKILDPKTGKEIEANSRRMRILNPKTGEEVTPHTPHDASVPVPAG